MFVNFAAARLRRLIGRLAMALCLAAAAGETLAEPVKPVTSLELYWKMYDASKDSGNAASVLYRVHEGLLDGVLAASQAYNLQGAPQRFCPPADVEFNVRVPFLNMIGDELVANPKYHDSPEKVDMGVVTLFALRRRFPCK